MASSSDPKLLVFCTVVTGLDSVLEVSRRGIPISAIVGLNPDNVDLEKVSGFIDIKNIANEYEIPFIYVDTYSLNSKADKLKLNGIDFDIIWVAGWQRLIPEWLIKKSILGALGGHGSPDGINGGRGRSPQNWALILGAKRFDISLFRITPGIDDGPIIAERSFFYTELDDIQTSYFKVSLCMADMICETMNNLQLIDSAKKQTSIPSYFPQRIPSDGYIDWNLEASVISRHCRALTKPYPGIRTSVKSKDIEILIWRIQEFDDHISDQVGLITNCFISGDFLVSCSNGRVLVREWESITPDWKPKVGEIFSSRLFSNQIDEISDRHSKKYFKHRIANRVRLKASRN